ncbi:DUF2075 domain-containing protein [Puniceicoccaceae bacterium K14]|nr:DUF2075 domain-containing protein [Puniceicoccaceae bacterium K14]
MIVYLETKDKFREDVFSNRIEETVLEAFRRTIGKGVSESELRSWKNSLTHMSLLLEDKDIPADAGVAIEFSIPNTAKRIDLILTGTRDDGQRSAVIIELKQWQTVEPTHMDAIVSTYTGGRIRETNHPSYQAWSYAMLVEDYNQSVQEDPIHLHPCAYLHNCESGTVINSQQYAQHTSRAPAFLKDDALKLRTFIKTHVKRGDSGETMYRIRDGKIRPSKSLADHLAKLLHGNQEFYMIGDQKLVYETAKLLAETSTPENKNVLIVNGGPGTGKSVVAINLLVELTNRGHVAQYVTKNAAPRAVYESKLAGTMNKSRISSLFVGSGSFMTTAENTFQTLIIDEAHRLNEKSGLFSKGENQIKEIISASAFTVFFLDEEQRIHWKDIGEKAKIEDWASICGATVTELSLKSQFRCNGSDGYLAWIDHTLGIRDTANTTLEDVHYDFKVCDTATELRDLIYERNQLTNKARMVAGYCWEWASKKNPALYDIEFPEQGFHARWNLADDGHLWIVKPETVKEIGCIHTCQGLELDYVGVIIGDDFLIRDGVIQTDGAKRSSQDRSMHGYKKQLKADKATALKKADEIIKNTYRTLMTRGQKGCYIYSPDPETNAYLKAASKGAQHPNISDTESDQISPLRARSNPEQAKRVEWAETTELPFTILPAEEVQPYKNSVPMFDVKVAAGSFSPEQWVEECEWVQLPEHLNHREGYFVAQVIGESMNLRIPNGSWCLFRANPVGSREGKIVLVQHREIQDTDTGEFSIKTYHSAKTVSTMGWRHERITLSPHSNLSDFRDITLENDEIQDLKVIGEFLALL